MTFASVAAGARSPRNAFVPSAAITTLIELRSLVWIRSGRGVSRLPSVAPPHAPLLSRRAARRGEAPLPSCHPDKTRRKLRCGCAVLALCCCPPYCSCFCPRHTSYSFPCFSFFPCPCCTPTSQFLPLPVPQLSFLLRSSLVTLINPLSHSTL